MHDVDGDEYFINRFWFVLLANPYGSRARAPTPPAPAPPPPPPISCFSGDSKVVTRESSEPVAMRDLRIGEHVLCYEGGPDLMAPQAERWCEVKNFVSDTLWEQGRRGTRDGMCMFCSSPRRSAS